MTSLCQGWLALIWCVAALLRAPRRQEDGVCCGPVHSTEHCLAEVVLRGGSQFADGALPLADSFDEGVVSNVCGSGAV